MNRLKLVRRIIEVALLSVCLYSFLFTTPVGELVRYGAHKLFGSKAKRRPLVSYFQTMGEESQSSLIAKELSSRLNENDPLYKQAEAVGLRPQMVRALLVTLSDGKLAKDGEAQIKLKPQAIKSLAAVQIKQINQITDPKLRRSKLLQGVVALKQKLKSEHGAIAALRIDLKLVEYALGRARASGRHSPETFIVFARYLPVKRRAEAKTFVSSVFALETAFGLKNPVRATHRVSSKFGYRVHPVLKTKKKHTGIDIAIPTGTALHASAGGHVVYSTQDGINGKFIKINHGNGLTSAYCHASKLLVKRGAKVAAGQKIALSGMTGRATGPHLHFQIEIDDVPIDPALFIRDFGKPKAISLGLEVDGNRRGLAIFDLDITHRRRRQRKTKTIHEVELH